MKKMLTTDGEWSSSSPEGIALQGANAYSYDNEENQRDRDQGVTYDVMDKRMYE